jgi:hypothetical protein
MQLRAVGTGSKSREQGFQKRQYVSWIDSERLSQPYDDKGKKE